MNEEIKYRVSENPIEPATGAQIGQPIAAVLPLDLVKTWLTDTNQKIGTRLPPERTLANTLHISRPQLRKALTVLELEGRITRHVGRGTYLAEPPPLLQVSGSLATLTDRIGPHDAMMARIALEPELARLSAHHATPRQIAQIHDLATDIRGASSWQTYEELDFALHDTIAASAGNLLLHELHKVMNAVRQVVVWRKLAPGVQKPPQDYHSFAEHDAIVTAIANRDGPGAKAAMRAHLRATLDTMTQDDQDH